MGAEPYCEAFYSRFSLRHTLGSLIEVSCFVCGFDHLILLFRIDNLVNFIGGLSIQIFIVGVRFYSVYFLVLRE